MSRKRRELQQGLQRDNRREVVSVVPSAAPDLHYVYFSDGTVILYDAAAGHVMRHDRLPDDLLSGVARYEAHLKAEEQATMERTSAAYGVIE